MTKYRDVYVAIAHAGSSVPDGIVWDNGASFTIFSGEDGVTLSFDFELPEPGAYVVGAYLPGIENPEMVTFEFEA